MPIKRETSKRKNNLFIYIEHHVSFKKHVKRRIWPMFRRPSRREECQRKWLLKEVKPLRRLKPVKNAVGAKLDLCRISDGPFDASWCDCTSTTICRFSTSTASPDRSYSSTAAEGCTRNSLGHRDKLTDTGIVTALSRLRNSSWFAGKFTPRFYTSNVSNQTVVKLSAGSGSRRIEQGLVGSLETTYL